MSWTISSCDSDGSSGSWLRETTAELDEPRSAAAAEGGNPGGIGRVSGDCAVVTRPGPSWRAADPGALLLGYSIGYLEGLKSTGLSGTPCGLADRFGTLAEGTKLRSLREFPRTGVVELARLGEGIKPSILDELVLGGFKGFNRSSIISLTIDL